MANSAAALEVVRLAGLNASSTGTDKVNSNSVAVVAVATKEVFTKALPVPVTPLIVTSKVDPIIIL